MLTVAVADAEGRPLAEAFVDVVDSAQIGAATGARTGADGRVTFTAVRSRVTVFVSHEYGADYRNTSVEVAQQGNTLLEVTLQPRRPRPTVALLPVTIPPQGVSADRSELTLQVSIVASAAARFVRAQYGDQSVFSTPSIELGLGQSDEVIGVCSVWLDQSRTVPSCENPWGESPYTASVLAFHYDSFGTAFSPVVAGVAPRAMVLLDQSGRVSALDPSARRSFATRAFIWRTVGSGEPQSLSIAGFAGDSDQPGTLALLPEQPVWVPLGSGTIFSTDVAALRAAVDVLELYVGGAAPVFDALHTAFTLTAAHAPSGNRAVVAMLGGGDDGDMTYVERREALIALRQQQDDAGIRTVLIAGAPTDRPGERLELAELSAALRAPAISLGVQQTWASGAHAALDLAADLIGGLPLPTLSAEFRVTVTEPGAFPAGEMLYGTISIDSDYCPWHCWEIPLEFAVEIP